MLTPRITPNQIRSMPRCSAAGPSSGMTMKASSKKSRKKASTNTKALTKIRKPIWPPGSEVSRCSTQTMAVDAVEGQREHARADQDEDHEGRQFCRRFGRLPDQVPAQPPLHGAENERAGGTHRAALGRRRNADEDRAEHQEDQEQRRHHHERGLLRHLGQEAEAGELVDDPVQHRDEEREQDAVEHAENDEIGAMRFGVSHHEPAEDAAGEEEHASETQPAAAVLLAESDRVRRQARAPPSGNTSVTRKAYPA